MEKAIKKLKELANDNIDIADRIESGDIKLSNSSDDCKTSLVSTYRYWSNSLLTAAWLLENENKIEDK